MQAIGGQTLSEETFPQRPRISRELALPSGADYKEKERGQEERFLCRQILVCRLSPQAIEIYDNAYNIYLVHLTDLGLELKPLSQAAQLLGHILAVSGL
jgi:hypothetical protein